MPLHPLIVHFPIALLLFGTLIEILALWNRQRFNTTGTILLIAGFVTGIISYITGEDAEHFAEEKWGDGVHSWIETHETLALVSLLLFGGATGLKILGYYFPRYQRVMWIIVIILAIAGSTTLAITGHYGGKIVYEN